MKEKLISIIIPVYNVDKYLDKCLCSVCAQTYTNLEIILVNDGSTDTSGEICNLWAKRDSRIKVVHQNNQGISVARNSGLDIATGDYIGFVDSDDRIDANMYECLYKTMCEHHCKIVACSYHVEEENGILSNKIYSNIPEGKLTIPEYIYNISQNPRWHCQSVVVWNKLFDASLLKNVRFKEGVVHEDEFFVNEIIKKTDDIYIIEDELYYYIQHDTSIMHDDFSLKRISYFYALKDRVLCLEEMQINKYTINLVKDDCIEVGIRYWLLINKMKLMTKREVNIFYQEVLEMINEYKTSNTKLFILQNMFVKTPTLLKLLYSFYKKLPNSMRFYSWGR